jgi:anti-sigma B factor antagonist
LEIEVRDVGHRTALVVPSGRLDLLSAAEVKAALTAAVADGSKYLVVDLSAVPFVDSSGLGALIGGLRAAREAGGDLRLAALNDQAAAVLKLTTLDRVLVPHTTSEDAIAALAT